MAREIVMPQMGAEMEEGTIVRWLKHPGDPVARGEPIAEIETDKATIELESFHDGVFDRAIVDEGAAVPVDTVIGYIRGPGETAAAPIGVTPAPAPARAEPERASESLKPPAGVDQAEPTASGSPAGNGARSASGKRLRVSPLARRIAAERGVDLTRVTATGPDGRILRRDIEAAAARADTPASAAAAAPPAASAEKRREPAPAGVQYETSTVEPARAETPPPASVEVASSPPGQSPSAEPLSRMRQAIARRMAQSKREAPHYYITIDVDMTAAMALRAELNAAAAGAAHLTVNDLLVKAAVQALRKYPTFNASFSEQGLVQHEQINLCIAVALPEGLIAPALLDCGAKSLGEISRAARDLGERARAGRLRPAELADGTFTISNLGAYGVETLIPIIQPPQSAIIGAGMVQSQPVVRDGEIVVRDLLKLALAADHRVTDGAQGAELMREVKGILETPLRLAL